MLVYIRISACSELLTQPKLPRFEKEKQKRAGTQQITVAQEELLDAEQRARALVEEDEQDALRAEKRKQQRAKKKNNKKRANKGEEGAHVDLPGTAKEDTKEDTEREKAAAERETKDAEKEKEREKEREGTTAASSKGGGCSYVGGTRKATQNPKKPEKASSSAATTATPATSPDDSRDSLPADHSAGTKEASSSSASATMKTYSSPCEATRSIDQFRELTSRTQSSDDSDGSEFFAGHNRFAPKPQIKTRLETRGESATAASTAGLQGEAPASKETAASGGGGGNSGGNSGKSQKKTKPKQNSVMGQAFSIVEKKQKQKHQQSEKNKSSAPGVRHIFTADRRTRVFVRRRGSGLRVLQHRRSTSSRTPLRELDVLVLQLGRGLGPYWRTGGQSPTDEQPDGRYFVLEVEDLLRL
eukprot:g9566.t1